MDSTSATHAVLVIAPEDDLRLSIAFMLQAEGYRVHAAPSWPPNGKIADLDGMVIDEAGVHGEMANDNDLEQFDDRILLLVSRLSKLPHLPHATVLRKPLLHGVLIENLRAMMATRQPGSHQ